MNSLHWVLAVEDIAELEHSLVLYQTQYVMVDPLMPADADQPLAWTYRDLDSGLDMGQAEYLRLENHSRESHTGFARLAAVPSLHLEDTSFEVALKACCRQREELASDRNPGADL